MSSQFERLRSKAERLKRLNQFEESAALFKRYVSVYPDDTEALMNLADLEMRLENFSDASKIYAALVEKFPKKSIHYANLGAALLRLGRVSDARAILDYALELDDKNLFARINLGGVLQAQEDFQGALKNALEAVSIAPTHPLTFNNLGSAFSDLDMIEEARHAYETSVMLEPNQVDALVNLGVVESKQGRHRSAIEHFERALAILPPEQQGRADAIKFFACFGYFYLDQWEKAWDYYELGFSPLVPVGGARSPRRVFPVPKWNGVAAPGRSLLIWREQGVGDEVLFASVLPEFEAIGMRVVLECDPRLVSLWQRSFPFVEVRPAAFNTPDMTPILVDYDFHLPICSLGPIFRRSLEDFDRFRPYIVPDPTLEGRLRERLKTLAGRRPKVGVLWRSIKLTPTRSRGYTLPVNWDGVLNRKDLCFFSLQYNVTEGEIVAAQEKFDNPLHHFHDIDFKDDFESVAALVSQLDLVISPDTTMFEIAGGLGIPTICMVVHPEGHYGCHDRFPFYPSVRVLTTDNFDQDAVDILKKLPSALEAALADLGYLQDGARSSRVTRFGKTSDTSIGVGCNATVDSITR